MKIKLLLPALFFFNVVFAQLPSNIICTNQTAEQVMLGDYNPADYFPTLVIENPHDIAAEMCASLSADSMKSWLETLASFYNRNTYSDTVSPTVGIGAARRWIYQKFTDYSSANENRLFPSYLQFDIDSTGECGASQFRNIFAVLPGTDTSDKSIIIVEAHVDSRCEDVCSGTCLAEGMEDNGSGTVLVMEMARVMSRFAFKRSIVFLVTIGEEQGLYGAEAFARYAIDKGIEIREVQNNDVIGGVICGRTASPPTDCTVEGQIDSTSVRIFTYGGYTTHKSLARFIKLEYLEESLQHESVGMNIHIMTPEDRTGRGSDHIPFRQHNYTASRLTAQHEHGNGNVTDTNYTDRQHSSRDILGIDTTGDSTLDSYYVDFNYLRRNTVINATAAAMAASGPLTPSFILLNDSTHGLMVQITSQQQYNYYRVSVRRILSNYDLDLLYEFNGTLSYIIPDIKKDSNYYVSVASMDTNNIESLFTIEKHATALGNTGGIGVNEISKYDFGFSISPNPASNDFSISDNYLGPLEIYNLMGCPVMEPQHSISYNQRFNTPSQPGIYFVKLQLSDKYIVRKLIVQ